MMIALGLMGMGCTQQRLMRREVHRTRRRPAPDPAIAAVLAARGRRDQARDIVARDPMMAHELRIGRPDLDRDYDDGGLVDLNAAPASAIARVCELDPLVAQAIVRARETAGGFLDVADVFGVVDVPADRWSMVRDRAVVVNL